MPIDAKTFQEWEPIASGRVRPEGMSDEAITAIIEAVNEYRDEHLAGTMPKPGEELQLKPSFSLLPQALAVQPATTHPVSDDSERSAWTVNPEGASKGKVIVYDVPLDQVKKDLIEHPEKIRALYPDLVRDDPGSITPEGIMALDHSSELYKDYQELTWRDTANDLASRGKVAIRYTKAPWLHMQGGILNNLQLKLEGAVQPYGEAATAFVMGVDDAAAFGAVRAAGEIEGTARGGVVARNPLGTERLGGVTATDPTEHYAQLESEYPMAHLAGQALGMLAPWGPANALFGKALGAGKVAGKALGGSLPARLATGAVAGTAAAAGTQAASDLVDIGADEARREIDPEAQPVGPALEEVSERAKRAGQYALPLAVGGAAVGELAAGRAHDVRWGNRYGGAPGRLEEDLGKDITFDPVRGPRSKTIEGLKVEARKADKPPGDMIAQEIGPPIAKVLDEDTRGVFEQVSTKRDEFLASPEGKAPLPMKTFLNKAFDLLRADMKANPPGGGVPTPVGKPGSADDLLKLTNQQIETVSTKPETGAIELSPEEAQAFLSRENMRKAWKSRAPVKAPKKVTTSPNVAPALSPPDELPPSALPTPSRPSREGVPAAPETVPNVPPRRSVPSAGGGPRYGAADALPGRRPPPPEPEPKPSAKAPVRVTAPGRKELKRVPRPERFAEEMRAAGVDKIYVVPRSLDAEGTETLLDKIAAEQRKGDRDVAQLDKAARVDRDARPLNGEPGAWSRLQNQHSEMIEKKKLAEQLAAPGGDAFKVLVAYGRQRRGEGPQVDVLRDAAKRAGVGIEDQLNRIRSIERYDDLRAQSNFETSQRRPAVQRIQSTADFGSIRLFPLWRALDPTGTGYGVGPSIAKPVGVAKGESDEERRKKTIRRSAEQ